MRTMATKRGVHRVPLLAPILLLGMPVGLVVIVASCWRAWRRRRAVLLWPAGAAAAGLGLALWIGLIDLDIRGHYWDGWDLNPEVKPEDLVGIYRHGQAFIELKDGGVFESSDDHGSWSYRWNQRCLHTGSRGWEVLSKRGELVLLPDACERDPDEWNKWAVWSR